MVKTRLHGTLTELHTLQFSSKKATLKCNSLASKVTPSYSTKTDKLTTANYFISKSFLREAKMVRKVEKINS